MIKAISARTETAIRIRSKCITILRVDLCILSLVVQGVLIPNLGYNPPKRRRRSAETPSSILPQADRRGSALRVPTNECLFHRHGMMMRPRPLRQQHPDLPWVRSSRKVKASHYPSYKGSIPSLTLKHACCVPVRGTILLESSIPPKRGFLLR